MFLSLPVLKNDNTPFTAELVVKVKKKLDKYKYQIRHRFSTSDKGGSEVKAKTFYWDIINVHSLNSQQFRQ